MPFAHLHLVAGGNEVAEGGASCAVDRCGMLAVVSLRAQRQVVGRCEVPAIAALATLDEEAEVLAMVILVVGEIVEHHASEHFLHIAWILCQESGQCQQIAVVENRA